ncbi:hypothetical protein ACQKIE_01230 [Luteibacter sp. NPDC031894]|uniref:hypothetical protein n=1 Tax=Luteibacter sp. NPDC031894 TaxID=3390572 RepID=UPI003D03FE9F
MRMIGVACLAAGMTICGTANAVQTLSTSANAWKVQNYPSGIVAYFTGSPCANGLLTTDTNESTDRIKQFYATVLSAKAMSAKITVDYDVSGAQCIVRTFGIDVQ